MRKTLLILLLMTITILMLGSAGATSGPQTAWSVFTLPNPVVTPNWRSYAPEACGSDPDACAGDSRFWEKWDFSVFSAAIDASFKAVNQLGKYHAVIMIMPLGDTPTFWNNIQLVYRSAASQGVALQVALYPKWKFGGEWCYLYSANAPPSCPRVTGTTTAVAYQQLRKMMSFVENRGPGCTNSSVNIPFAIWYGWKNFSPGYEALRNFWQSLPTSGCNLRASYITWLDTAFTGTAAVQRLQKYAIQLGQPYWVNTELYTASQLQQYGATYAPYQTIITGFWGATDIAGWAQGMCSKWNIASQPVRLGAWTLDDRDISPIELYRSYINGSMAVIGSICTY
jgi:hypothetical protein